MTLTPAQLDAIAKCARRGCNLARLPSSYDGHCVMHFRIKRMRDVARSRNKLVPSYKELERLWKLAGDCPHCGVPMSKTGYIGRRGSKSNTLTLQHYADGTLGLICHACNVKDGQLPPGVYFATPDGHKYCTGCKRYLPKERFTRYLQSRRGGILTLQSRCKPCLYSDSNARRRNMRRLRSAAQLVERMDER